MLVLMVIVTALAGAAIGIAAPKILGPIACMIGMTALIILLDLNLIGLAFPAIALIAGAFAGHVGRHLYRDFRYMAGQLPKAGRAGLTAGRIAGLSIASTIPAILFVWGLLHVSEAASRSMLHGCAAYSQESLFGLRSAQQGGAIPTYYGRQQGGEFFVLHIVEAGPAIWPISAYPLLHPFCGAADLDSENSLIATIAIYADRMRDNIRREIDAKLARMSETGSVSAADALTGTFGPDSHWNGLRRNTRTKDDKDECSGIIASTSNCYLPIPACRGWLRSPVDCFLRKGLKQAHAQYATRRDRFEVEQRAVLLAAIANGEDAAQASSRLPMARSMRCISG